jgi:hypothetical protein
MTAFSNSHVLRMLLAIPLPRPVIDAASRPWRLLTTSLFDPYRPELHYMRGPGPKCRERLARGTRPLNPL